MINLTQHTAAPEQVAAGVVDLPPQQRELLRELLTFDDLPTGGKVEDRAEAVADIAAAFFEAAAGGTTAYSAAREAVWAAQAARSAAAAALSTAADDEVDGAAAVALFAKCREARGKEKAAAAALSTSRVGRRALIGGVPYLMAPLERALRRRGVTPLYAFSRRESREETLPDGSVRKTATFRHMGFVGGV